MDFRELRGSGAWKEKGDKPQDLEQRMDYIEMQSLTGPVHPAYSSVASSLFARFAHTVLKHHGYKEAANLKSPSEHGPLTLQCVILFRVHDTFQRKKYPTNTVDRP